MATSHNIQHEIKTWLQVILKSENLKTFSVNVLGNSEKGDGYIGDIVFASVKGVTENEEKNYNLVLKCSKRSQALRETSPVKEAFLNEILMYETILPYFTKFQEENGVRDIFNSVPKCYGSYVGNNMEIIVFENLKCCGYDLWPRKQPLTKKHLELVVTEYGKFHATSLALEHQQPEKFKKVTSSVHDVFEKFANSGNMNELFGTPIDESYELLKNDLDEKTLQKWKNFKKDIHFVINEMFNDNNSVKVILHGDCWNNNFMYVHKKGEKIPLKVAILDFQISRYSSPISDLSYFLFSCAGEEELQNLDDILITYHTAFVRHLKQCNVKETLYSQSQFFDDWKKYCKYGILMASLLLKIVSSDKDEVIDIAQAAEDGKDFLESFAHKIRDTDNYKRRIKPIIEYAVKNNVI